MDTAFITILTGCGACGVFCVLFVMGLIFPRAVIVDKDRVIAELKEALEAERDRATAAVAAATTTRDVLAAFQMGRGAIPVSGKEPQ